MENLMEDAVMMDRSQVALQIYHKGVITKKQLSELVGIDFSNGEINTKTWENKDTACRGQDQDLAQFLMQLYDNRLITEEVLLKKIFGMEVEEEIKEEIKKREIYKNAHLDT